MGDCFFVGIDEVDREDIENDREDMGDGIDEAVVGREGVRDCFFFVVDIGGVDVDREDMGDCVIVVFDEYVGVEVSDLEYVGVELSDLEVLCESVFWRLK